MIILSVAISASYSLGPDAGTVSIDEYRAMSYVWTQERNNQNHCIVSDTYPLLALEQISDKKIVGGGFPIDSNFAQPELVSLNSVLENGGAVEKVYFDLTKTDHCWVVSSSNQTNSGRKNFGTVSVQEYYK